MKGLERREALKVAGAVALATTLTAVGASAAQEPAGKKARADHPDKRREPGAERPKWLHGCVYSVLAGSGQFTFGINACGVPYDYYIDLESGEYAVRLVMLAFEKGLILRVFGIRPDNKPELAELVQILR